ncbi:helix-turn-helix domain-containing protein [Actinomadura sp. WAC 06369]|uniref:helix-turn-helix domain-containing protein n=1 Tax=Actinomadura sp. WAC 06369 TaxID=2203193 RepID=UPI000F7A3807|nr:helix-turn-helix transcriptional regulator [Actinomadura sp. WAC 06369]RSN70402.1 transcriptional regulator [Actinomadura sp. WAC 06369]
MTSDNGDAVSATVRRWQLTASLKQLREAAGLTIEQAVQRLNEGPGRWSKPKLSRIENRHQGVKLKEVEQLLDLYGADAKTRTELLELAGTVGERGWWLTYRRDLPEDFHPLFNLEVAMVARRQFETLIVPGLVQTGDYARALINGIEPGLATTEVDRRVTARLARQQILSRESPPELHIILEESILERQVGTPKTMRTQLRRLAEIQDSGNATVQVLPKKLGASPALGGPFSILTLPEPIPDIGYTEGIGGSIYLETTEAVRFCTLRFGILTELALSPDDSVNRILSAAEAYE